MVRSMYSGVSGMRAHQTRMDVIGNNIANVNTYGFKSSRATFRDIYYQNIKGASAASSSSGGVNPSSVGVGTRLASIDTLQTRSSFTQTDKAMDVAIDGEGFFQVQDPNGNIFYTRAGQMDFDSAGNLVDSQGNFVLGISGNPIGKAASSDIIKVQIPSVQPKASSKTFEVNGNKFIINTTKETKEGNVSMTFAQGTDMADDETISADVGTNGITINVNPTAKFKDAIEFSTAMDEAIQKASRTATGVGHPAGTFSISCDPSDSFKNVTGKEICSTDYGTQYGKIKEWAQTIAGGIVPTGVSSDNFGVGWTPAGQPAAVTDLFIQPKPNGTKPTSFDVSMKIGGKTYTATVTDAMEASGKMRMKSPDPDSQYIEMKRPSFQSLKDAVKVETKDTATPPNITITYDKFNTTSALATLNYTATASTPSRALGLSSSKVNLEKGTEGGAQGIENLSGIVIGSDGIILAQHPEIEGDIYIGRIDLVTFANPGGLSSSGGTYFNTSANSGELSFCKPGMSGSGQTVSGSLELSNADLSREFTDMITTQRGYQANSRVITVSDTMLEELVNLKR